MLEENANSFVYELKLGYGVKFDNITQRNKSISALDKLEKMKP